MNMTLALLHFLILAVLTLTSCVASKNEINLKKYPRSRYLVGEGISKFKGEAKDAAIADIAKIFNTHIERVGYRRSGKGGSKFNELLSVTEVDIEGIRVVAVHHDPKKKRYHALAVLDKHKFIRALATKILPMSKTYKSFVKEYAKFKRAGAFDHAVPLLKRALQENMKAKPYLQQLRVVDQATDHYFPDVEKHYANVRLERQRLKFCTPDVSDEALKSIVSLALDKNSIVHARVNGCKRKIVLEFSKHFGDKANKTLMVSGTLDLRLYGLGGTVFETYSYQANGMGKDKQSALTSLYRNLRHEITHQTK